MSFTLGVCLMLKNEINQVERTILSCLEFADKFIILDTGSDDGTPHHISFLCNKYNKKYIIFEEPFVNFSVSRNKLLELARPECDFMLLLDANDELKGGKMLKEFIYLHPDHDIYMLKQILDNTSFRGQREVLSKIFVIRSTNKEIHYRYPVHEEFVLGNTKDIIQILSEDIYIYQNRELDKPSSYRFKKDLELLLEELKRDPQNTRLMFYTAQTLCCLNEYEESLFFTHQIMSSINYEEPIDEKHLWSCYSHISNCMVIFKEKRNEEMKKYINEGFCRLFYYAKNQRMEPFSLYGQYAILNNRLDIAYIYIKVSLTYKTPKDNSIRYFESMYHSRKYYLEYCKEKLSPEVVTELNQLDIQKIKMLPLMEKIPVNMSLNEIIHNAQLENNHEDSLEPSSSQETPLIEDHKL